MEIKINDEIISGYSVNKFNLISNFNEHCKLEIELELDFELENISNSKIEIDNIFLGNIYEYEMCKYLYDGFKLYIIAYSYTKKLDIESKTRIYQDINITYEQIIDDVLKEYNIKYITSKNLKKCINRIYFQDNVTDFEFLKRILVDIDEAIFSSYNGLIVFGIDSYSYAEIEQYIEKTTTNKGIVYKIQNRAILPIDNVENMYVVKSNITILNGIIVSNILLTKKLNQKKIKSNVKGRFLEAKVFEILQENEIAKMKVIFIGSNIVDKSINKKALSFATPYSKTQTGLYVTPELGDNVEVYFPTDDENDAKVSFCINNSNSSRFTNYKERNYIMTGISLNLKDENIKIHSNSFGILSLDEVNIVSNGYIALESVKDSSIYASNILLNSKQNDIEISSNKNLLLKANKIHND